YAHPILGIPFLSGQGLLKAAPFVFSPVTLCYNRKLFAQCGLDAPNAEWTWDTLLRSARLIYQKLGVHGFISHIQSVNRWPLFLLQNGFRFQVGYGRNAAEDPSLLESFRISRDLIYQQGAPALWTEKDADVENWFKEGKVSMILTTYFGLNPYMDTALDYGVAPLPALRTNDTLLLSVGLAVNRQSAHPEAAERLIHFLCGLDV
ncbi:extracellular solute-binding protein, partial [Cutibacterium acnes]